MCPFQVNVFRPAMVDVSKPLNDMSNHLLKGMHLFNPVNFPQFERFYDKTLVSGQ
jgi:hypothetical protein